MNSFSEKKQKIRICFCSLYAYHYFNPALRSKFGGAELQLYYFATELAKDNRFDVHFIVGNFGQPDFEIRERVKLHKGYFPPKGLKYTQAIFRTLKRWQLFKKVNADIYIHRIASFETFEIGLFCELYKKKFIYMTAHDDELIVDKKPGWLQKGLMALVRWKLFQRGLKMADLVVVQHEAQKEQLKKNYHKEGIVRLSAHRLQKEVPLVKRESILWVARCEPWKKPEILINLAKELPQEKFVMVCQPAEDKSFFLKIRNLAASVPNLQFIEYVPSDQIGNYFLKAKVFLNTSDSEGFPNTFIDAAKNKTPIVSLNIDPNGIIEKHKIGLVAQGSFPTLIQHLKEISGSKMLRQEMSESCFHYVRKYHDIEKIIEEDKKMILSIFIQTNKQATPLTSEEPRGDKNSF